MPGWPCGQPGTRERLVAQKAFRVPFALAASLPRCASQALGRHSPQQPLEYVGRWGKAHSEETLTAFHHRLLLGALRLAQAGCVTDEGLACSINMLLLAAEGKGTRELGVARDQVPPRANATYTAHHVADHSGEPYIAEQRRLERPIIDDVLVRTADDPQRLVSLAEITVRGDDGRWQQTARLARGGGASILIVFAGWVLDALNAPAEQASRTFVLLDTVPFLQVGSRRLFSWLAAQTAPAIDPNWPCPTACQGRRRTPSTSGSTSTGRACAISAATARISTVSARIFARTSPASTGSPTSIGGSTSSTRSGRAA